MPASLRHLPSRWECGDQLTLTKKSLRATEQDRPDVAAAREAWRAAQPGLDPKHLIFIDETWAKTNMTRLRGRARKGAHLVGAAPHGHWRTTTFLAGLRHDRLTAPAVFDGAITGETFTAYVEQVLAPTLSPGDIVVLDNLPSHKVAGVRELVEARAASMLFLPPYSPDLNPIEQVSAKLKQLIRSAEPRSREALWNKIGSTIGQFTPGECTNYLANAGYRRSG
jgi:transposase